MSAYLSYSARGAGGGGGGVTSLNSLTGALTLSAGTGVSITDNGVNMITITNSGVVSFNTRTGAVTLSGTDVTTALGYTPENAANKGIANGYASLDSGGKVPVSQLPNSIMEYQGTWSAATNTPTLVNGVGSAGDVYINQAAGTVDFGAGPITFAIGDWVVYDGSVWQKSINSNAVASVFGRTGAVTAQSGDYTTAQVTESGNLYFTDARAIAAPLTGYVSGAGTVSATDSILQAIQKLNGNIGALVTGVSSVNSLGGALTIAAGTSGTDFAVSALGSTITLDLPTASASARGALSSADWSTFNSKQAALTFSTGLTNSANTITNNLSVGVAGGQSVIGGTASGDNLTLSSTANATKGNIVLGSLSAYDEVNDRLGIGTTSPASKIDIRTNALGVTQTATSGLALANTTAASSGNQQISPAVRFSSNGWGTTAGTSQDVSFRAYSKPVQGTTPSGQLIIERSINGGAYTNVLNLDSTANLTVTSSQMAPNTSFTYSSGGSTTLQSFATTRMTANGSAAQFDIINDGQTKLTQSVTGSNSTAGLQILPTWNTSGSPTALLVNATNTASGASTLLADFQVGGVSQFKVDKTGVVTLASALPISSGGTGQTTKAAAFDALSPMTTGGDLIYGGASGTGTRLANGSAGQVLTSSGGTSAPSWQTPTGVNQSYLLNNLGLSTSVGSNNLTIALKQADGSSDPSGAAPVQIGFRSSTAADGAYNVRSVSSALSIVVPSGTTLGTVNGAAEYIYIYAIDNAGTVELAVSVGAYYDTGTLVSTTAISGGASRKTLYSTTARSNVPIRFIGRIKITEATAGTWASNATEISDVPFSQNTVMARYSTAAGQTVNSGALDIVNFGTKVYDTHSAVTTGGSWNFSAPFPGRYRFSVTITWASASYSSGQTQNLFAYKNGSAYSEAFLRNAAAVSGTLGVYLTDAIELAAGDTIDFRIAHSEGSSRSLTTSATQNFCAVEWIGPI